MTTLSDDRARRSPRKANDQRLEALIDLADQCVKCGYCLAHCPTFKLARCEGESPRGRIALIQGWASGQINNSPRLETHLDNCLECRACEPSCPSLVRYAALMDGARAARMQGRPGWQRALRRLRLDLLTRPAGLRLTAAVGILYRWLPLPARLVARSARRWPLIAVLDPLARSLRWPRDIIAAKRRPAVVADASAADRAPILFRGCVARLTDQPLEAAALQLFDRLGLQVEVPRDQGCCGAIHRHNGFPAEADQQLAVNSQCSDTRPVIGLASACVAELREQGGLEAVEVCRFLLSESWPADIELRPLAASVAVHEPCSHRNQLRDQDAVYQLLRRIPGIILAPLPDNGTCCGAAGTYLTTHPGTAISLAAPKVEALRSVQPDYLVTTNTGCPLHLSARVSDAGLAIEVLHPIQLIERQLSTRR